MKPKSFLLFSGIALVLLALVGNLGLGPTAVQSMFGKWLWLDQTSTILHLIIGLVALLSYKLIKSDQMQRYIIAVIGFIFLASVLAGFLFASNPAPNLGFTNLEQPMESLLNLAFAVWALWVALMPEGPVFVKEAKK